MPRWRTTTTGNRELVSSALPQLAADQPLTALNAMQLLSQLRGSDAEAEAPKADSPESRYQELRQRVHARLVRDTAYLSKPSDAAVRERLAELVNEAASELGPPLDLEEAQETITRIHHELLGFGPLERLIADPTITEIMVNGHDEIWIERAGRLARTQYRFETSEQLLQLIDRMVSRVGTRGSRMDRESTWSSHRSR